MCQVALVPAVPAVPVLLVLLVLLESPRELCRQVVPLYRLLLMSHSLSLVNNILNNILWG